MGGGNGYYVAEEEAEIASALETLESRMLNTAEHKMALRRAAQQWDDVDADGDYDIL
ncbi:hypothetical protein [Haloarcula sp. JP-L23]|uniref:hypothetical protein n=1 Tax=Haloarcula sp. JP-L23 TaxID=2716717 RepID=UPI00140EEBE6|nr:hypothetical protein G9465_22995 [Haloarcula sp. JP-L23]